MDESGLPCVLNVSNRYGEKRRELRLHGDNGVLVLPNDDAGSITLIKNGGYIIPEHQLEIPYSGPSALETELSTFIDYLASKDDKLLCDVKTGIGVVKNIEKIRILTKQGEK